MTRSPQLAASFFSNCWLLPRYVACCVDFRMPAADDVPPAPFALSHCRPPQAEGCPKMTGLRHVPLAALRLGYPNPVATGRRERCRFWHLATLQARAFDVRFQGIPDLDDGDDRCRYRLSVSRAQT